MIGITAEWLSLWALWLLFAGSAGTGELVIGGVAAALGTALSRAARATRLARFRPHPAWLMTGWRLPSLVARDVLLLMAGLLRRASGRPSEGRLFEIPIDAPGRGPASASYRALTTALTSLPPNTYVIDIDPDRGVAIVHRLVPTRKRPALVLPEWRR